MPIPKGQRKTDAQRRASYKYDSAHYTVLGCKLKSDAADAFRAACAASGTTPNAIFTACALDYIAAHAAPDQAAPKEE